MTSPRHRRRPPSQEEVELQLSAPADRTLGPAIRAYLEGRGLGPVARFGKLAACWDDVVGRDIAAHCRPLRLEGDELIVEADHQTWVTDFAFRSHELLTALEREVGEPVARSVKVRVRRRPGVE